MISCWQRDPQLRSSFSRLASQCGALLRQEGITVETDAAKVSGAPLPNDSHDQDATRSTLSKEVAKSQTSPVHRPSYLKRSLSLKMLTKKVSPTATVEPAPEPLQPPLMDDVMRQLERASPLAFRYLKTSSSNIGSSCPDITLKAETMAMTTSKSEDEYTVMYAAPPARSTSLLQLVAKAEDRGHRAINRGRRGSLQLHKIWTPIEEYDEVSMEHNWGSKT